MKPSNQVATKSNGRRVTLPVLALYGGMDSNVLAQRNAAALASSLKKAGNRDYKIVIFPKANHDGLEAKQGQNENDAGFKRFVPGYFIAEIDWLRVSVLGAH